MGEGVRERIEGDEIFFDSAIISHGFARHLRDYDVVIDNLAAASSGMDSGYLYRFTHCVEAQVTTALIDQTWRASWDDVLTDFEAWQRAGEPTGYVWGTCWAEAYPGLSYVADSESARAWSSRLAQTMHEARIETNVFVLSLVFHDLYVEPQAHVRPDTDADTSPT